MTENKTQFVDQCPNCLTANCPADITEHDDHSIRQYRCSECGALWQTKEQFLDSKDGLHFIVEYLAGVKSLLQNIEDGLQLLIKEKGLTPDEKKQEKIHPPVAM